MFGNNNLNKISFNQGKSSTEKIVQNNRRYSVKKWGRNSVVKKAFVLERIKKQKRLDKQRFRQQSIASESIASESIASESIALPDLNNPPLVVTRQMKEMESYISLLMN